MLMAKTLSKDDSYRVFEKPRAKENPNLVF